MNYYKKKVQVFLSHSIFFHPSQQTTYGIKSTYISNLQLVMLVGFIFLRKNPSLCATLQKKVLKRANIDITVHKQGWVVVVGLFPQGKKKALKDFWKPWYHSCKQKYVFVLSFCLYGNGGSRVDNKSGWCCYYYDATTICILLWCVAWAVFERGLVAYYLINELVVYFACMK